MGLVEKIELKISQLREQEKKQNSDFVSFSNGRRSAEKNLSILDGAIQAYQDILNTLKEEKSDTKSELTD